MKGVCCVLVVCVALSLVFGVREEESHLKREREREPVNDEKEKRETEERHLEEFVQRMRLRKWGRGGRDESSVGTECLDDICDPLYPKQVLPLSFFVVLICVFSFSFSLYLNLPSFFYIFFSSFSVASSPQLHRKQFGSDSGHWSGPSVGERDKGRGSDH